MNYDDPQSQDLEEAEDDGRTSKLPLKPVPLSIRMEEQKKRLLLPLVSNPLFVLWRGKKDVFGGLVLCAYVYPCYIFAEKPQVIVAISVLDICTELHCITLLMQQEKNPLRDLQRRLGSMA